MSKIKSFFSHSKTILIARITAFGGLLIELHDLALPYIIQQDWSPITAKLPPYALPLLLMFLGIMFEYLRRITKESIHEKKEYAQMDAKEKQIVISGIPTPDEPQQG